MDKAGRARDKILYLLKTKGPQQASILARKLGVTPMAVRQHLYRMHGQGEVEYNDERRKVGRPARIWRLTAATGAHFPDSHGELAVGILQAATAAFGPEGVARLMDERTRAQARAYARRMRRDMSLAARVAELAAIRREEGYLAEHEQRPDGTLVLVENHCPICAAAQTCQDLCRGELALFRRLLPGTEIERHEHILAGQRRCLYTIRRREH
ncbi:MAG: transcriptional regulator [Planctomycetes bacterium]|jgi:predicted ArsR family transcriptional regulator|nr:transcriptional regulator [Planctomycetota bacterium]MCL4730928.1 transcriptional regulator [Planctomycetota bacterium]